MTLNIQKASLSKVQSIIAAGGAKIAALDPGLRPDARQDRIASIRADVSKEIASTRDDMKNRQAQAKEGLPRWSQDAVRRRAKFAEDPALDAQQRIATMETLKRVHTGELLRYLEDAIADKSIARAEAIRLEFHSRGDKTDHSLGFAALFGAVVDRDAKTMESELAQIDGLAAHADTLIREFETGFSNPAERIATARMAGLALSPERIAHPAANAA